MTKSVRFVLAIVLCSLGCSYSHNNSAEDESKDKRNSQIEEKDTVPTIRFVLGRKETQHDPRTLDEASARYVWNILSSEPLEFDLKPKDLKPSGHFVVVDGDDEYRVLWASNEVWKLLGNRKARWHEHELFKKMSDELAGSDEEPPAQLDAIIALIANEAKKGNSEKDEKKDSKKDGKNS